MWPNMGQSKNIFKGGSDKVVPFFDDILNVEGVEAQCRTLELPQRWQ